MGLSKEDVLEIIQLLDDLKATELHLRTRHYTLSLRRDGDGWAQMLNLRPFLDIRPSPSTEDIHNIEHSGVTGTLQKP